MEVLRKKKAVSERHMYLLGAVLKRTILTIQHVNEICSITVKFIKLCSYVGCSLGKTFRLALGMKTSQLRKCGTSPRDRAVPCLAL